MTPQVPPLTQITDDQGKKEDALVDALQASQAANQALEQVIKLQARAIEEMLRENKKLCQQAKEAHLKAGAMPVMCEASTQILPEEAALFTLVSTQDASVQILEEDRGVTTVQTVPDLQQPQGSPRIQPPVVPPTPRRASKNIAKGEPRIQAPSAENMKDMEKISQANASPYVAEAFRLGWLAGVKSNSLAANKSPSSTRSDDSQPSDPGSFVVGSRGSESCDSRGSESPPGPNDKLPLLPPPPPPMLLVPPPEIPFAQLG